MSNENIISEFNRLIAYLKDQSDDIEDKKEKNQNNFRVRQLARVVSILKNYNDKITIDNYKDLIEISGIGKGSIKRIEEILKDGHLSEIGNFVDEKAEKNKIINELEEVVGIGRTNAVDLYEKGIKSVKMLKSELKKGKIEVNDKIKLGLKYHNVYKTNIPREEITKVYKLIEKIIKKLNSNEDDKHKYKFEICGSYRREKNFSNDIDILITKKGIKSDSNINYLDNIVNQLKSNVRGNNNKPLLIDHMTDNKITTKYMGFSKYKDNPVRRIDIRFVSYDSFASALLYFTGSKDFNRKMRSIAKDKGYKLSEYGLFDSNDEKVKLKSEKAIFEFLDMDYVEPKDRL